MNWFSGRLEVWFVGSTGMKPDAVHHDLTFSKAQDLLDAYRHPIRDALYYPATCCMKPVKQLQSESRDDNRDDYQEAYIKACELDSPNLLEFDALVQRIFGKTRS